MISMSAEARELAARRRYSSHSERAPSAQENRNTIRCRSVLAGQACWSSGVWPTGPHPSTRELAFQFLSRKLRALGKGHGEKCASWPALVPLCEECVSDLVGYLISDHPHVRGVSNTPAMVALSVCIPPEPTATSLLPHRLHLARCLTSPRVTISMLCRRPRLQARLRAAAGERNGPDEPADRVAVVSVPLRPIATPT